MQTDVTVESIFNWLNGWAPFSGAEEWDNTGLLVGSMDAPVKRVMVSLDVTPEVIGQAAEYGAELMISHHPLIFRPISRLQGGEPPYLLARYGISAIAAHTNLDKANGGVNDILAARLGLHDISAAEDGLCRVGSLANEMRPHDFAGFVGSRLGVPDGGIKWCNGGRPVRTVAVCGGSGGDFLPSLPPNADAFVTGELRYHDWPANPARTIVAAGHFYTEIIVVKSLAERLAGAFPEIQVIAAKEQCPYRII